LIPDLERITIAESIANLTLAGTASLFSWSGAALTDYT
jgi:hypothetical protein